MRILESVWNVCKILRSRKRFMGLVLFLAAGVFAWPFVFPIWVTDSRLPYEYTIHGTYVEINKYIGNEEEVVIPEIIWFRPVTMIAVTEQWHESGFDHNNKIKSVYIPNTVKEIGFSCFFKCVSLEKVHLSASLEIIGDSAFWGCRSLRRIDIPDKAKVIGGGAFGACENLETVILPDNLKVIGGSAFKDCKNLEYIEIPESVEEIEGGAFAGTGWENNLGEEFTVAGKNVLIYYGGAEETVKVLEGVEYIGYSVFWKDMNMRQLILPETLKKCSEEMFVFCDNLEYVVFKNSDIEFQEIMFVEKLGKGVTVVGKRGSAVEVYAEKMGCTFQDIELWDGEFE